MKIFAVSGLVPMPVGSTTASGVTFIVTGINQNQYIGVSLAATNSVILPSAAQMTGYCVTIKDQGGNFSSFACTVGTTASQVIDSNATYKLTQKYQSGTFYSDGTKYWVV